MTPKPPAFVVHWPSGRTSRYPTLMAAVMAAKPGAVVRDPDGTVVWPTFGKPWRPKGAK